MAASDGVTPAAQRALRRSPAVQGVVTEFLYVVASTSGRGVKLGRSVDPGRRLKGLQTGSPHRLGVVETFPVPAHRVREFEGFAHELFAWARSTGEWFDLMPAEARAVLHMIAEEDFDGAEKLARLIAVRAFHADAYLQANNRASVKAPPWLKAARRAQAEALWTLYTAAHDAAVAGGLPEGCQRA